MSDRLQAVAHLTRIHWHNESCSRESVRAPREHAMNRVAIFLTLLVLAAFQPQAPILAGGDDTPEPGRQAIDKGRPFLEGIPNWAKGIGIARDVLDGKEGAQEQ